MTVAADAWTSDNDALSRHQDQNAESQLLREKLREARDRGVEFVYFSAVTLRAKVIAKVVPIQHAERLATSGVRFFGATLSDQQTNIHGELIGGGVSAPEILGMADVDTFDVMPWDNAMARVLCSVYHPNERPGVGGQRVAVDSRAMLRERHIAFSEQTGMQLRSGCEPELTWVGPGLEVAMLPGSAASYRVEYLEVMRPILKQVLRYCHALGFDMVEGDYEDPGQLELNFKYDVPELTADRLVLYRQVCRQVAKEFGVQVTFMAKPASGAMGSGCHHNLSLWRDDVNLFEDGRREIHVSEVARHALGGILEHSPGMMSVMASTVNSYKRFWDIGMFAPSHIDWGFDDRTCTVRVPANGRIEFKIPDASVNPYLSHTLLLAAIQDGLDRSLEPGPSKDERGVDQWADQLPLTLGDALRAFRNDPLMWNAFPREMAETYEALKSDEWARACGAVTSWDHEMYFDGLP